MSGRFAQSGGYRSIRKRLPIVLPVVLPIVAALVVGAIPAGAYAAKTGATVAPPLSISAMDVLNVGGSLTMVLLAVVIIAWLYGRVQGLRGSSGQVIQVVASQALGPKERVLIVEVAGQQLVLGVTAAGMRTLHVLESPVDTGAEPDAVQSFAARLGEALKKSVS